MSFSVSIMEDSHVASAIALLLSRSIFAPLERAKLLMQTAGASTLPQSERYSSVLHYLAKVPAREGVLGYWRGHLCNVTKMSLSTVVKFGSYTILSSKTDSPLYNLFAGATAGLVSVVATYPMDLARTKLATEVSRKGIERQFSGVIDCLVKTSKEGWGGLFRGVGVCAASSVPFTGVSFLIHDSLLQHLPTKVHDTAYSKVLEFFGASSIAIVTAQTVCYPLDTLRRRLQVSGSLQYLGAKTASEVGWQVWESEGVRGFYRGCLVNCLKSAPCLAVQFTVYDWSRDFMTRS
jgi:hypothetical protein